MPKLKDQEKTIGTVGRVNPEPSVFARSNKTAPRVFGLLNSKFNRVPRYRFLFWVNFVRNDLSVNKTYSNWQDGVSLLVEGINRPSMNFNLNTLNQYNKKRLVQSGVSYSPVTVRLYDTVDQKVFSMFHDYFQYYYGDGLANQNSWNYDIITPEYFPVNNEKDFGFNPPSVNIATDNIFSSSNNYFFERLEIYEFNHKKFNKYSLIHPKISSFTYDDNTYRDMGTPQMITLTFSYEGVVWEAINQPIDEELLEQAGRRIGEFQEVNLSEIFLIEDGLKDTRDSFIKSGIISRGNIFTNPSNPITNPATLEKSLKNSPFNPFGDNEYQFFSGNQKSDVNFSNVDINANDAKAFGEILKSSTASVGKKSKTDNVSSLKKVKIPFLSKSDQGFDI